MLHLVDIVISSILVTQFPGLSADNYVCYYNGERYMINEQFEQNGGCNTCSCEENGGIACTEMWCNSMSALSSEDCTYEGNVYGAMDTWQDSKGCTCRCEYAAVQCSLVDCQDQSEENYACYYNGQRYKGGQDLYQNGGCNSCICGENGLIGCTKMWCEALSDLSTQTCTYKGKTYEPNQSWFDRDGCTCQCSYGAVECNLVNCQGQNADNYLCYYNGKRYKPGDAFRQNGDCNDCWCTDNGSLGCTMALCDAMTDILNEPCSNEGNTYESIQRWNNSLGCPCFCMYGAVECNLVDCTVPDEVSDTCYYNGERYKPGNQFDENGGCNTCFCDETGAIGCTEAWCDAMDTLSHQNCEFDGMSYEPNESFKDSHGCNCHCDLAAVSCNLVDCEDGWTSSDVCIYWGTVYHPGDSFTSVDGCNTCFCDEDTNVACTEMACIGGQCTYNSQTYQQMEIFSATDGCNECICGKDGEVTCTTIHCPGGQCVYNGLPKLVGDTFYSLDGCNECICDTDFSVACSKYPDCGDPSSAADITVNILMFIMVLIMCFYTIVVFT